MKIDKYKGYNDDSRYKEGVITLLEEILERLPKIEKLEEKEALAEVINTLEKKTKTRKKKEEVEVK